MTRPEKPSGGIAVVKDRRRYSVVGTDVDHIAYEDALDTLLAWGRNRESRYACFCNVHSVVTAASDANLSKALTAADLVLPDGMPVAWVVGRLSGERQSRISGPDVTASVCSRAADLGLTVGFVGGTPETLASLSDQLARRYPELDVAGMISPPFRVLDEQEERELVETINAWRAAFIFVGLGCPKQEIWMARQSRRVDGVMLGVGAAFDFLAGTVKRPPSWMRRAGIEWFGRLAAEPGRLWRRYLVTNSLFLWYVLRDVVRSPRGLRK